MHHLPFSYNLSAPRFAMFSEPWVGEAEYRRTAHGTTLCRLLVFTVWPFMPSCVPGLLLHGVASLIRVKSPLGSLVYVVWALSVQVTL